MGRVIGIGGLKLGCDICRAGGAVILDCDADVFTILLLEIYVFGDDWIIAVANDEQLGLLG